MTLETKSNNSKSWTATTKILTQRHPPFVFGPSSYLHLPLPHARHKSVLTRAHVQSLSAPALSAAMSASQPSLPLLTAAATAAAAAVEKEDCTSATSHNGGKLTSRQIPSPPTAPPTTPTLSDDGARSEDGETQTFQHRDP